jgi:hypothetical protein
VALLITAFEPTQDDVDDLMIARIHELESESEARTLLEWFGGFIERTAHDSDERDVLTAWRAVSKSHLRGFYNDGRQRDELKRLLRRLLDIHERRYDDEQRAALAEESTKTPEEFALDQERTRAALKTLFGRQRASQPKAPGKFEGSPPTRVLALVRSKAEGKALINRLRLGKRILRAERRKAADD